MNWHNFFKEEQSKEYYQALQEQVENNYQNKTIYPAKEDLYKAFELTPLDKIKVVIIGQDPYHGPNQAMGLAFSVPKTEKIPPSLVNIFKEISRDYECEFIDGDLTRWAQEGVFLLNTTLTVEEGKPNSHKDIGWQIFTDNVIQYISHHNKHVVFLLWGNHAKSKARLISDQHVILTSSHPSPLGAYRGFNGCGHFKKTNDCLSELDLPIINWQN